MKDRNYLISMYNATSTEDAEGSDELETYEDWLERQLLSRIETIEKLQAFKDYVHKRLDDAGVEKEPDGEHSKHGCRIGDRLDIVLPQEKEFEVKRLINGRGHSHLVVITEEALEDVHIGTVVIIPHAEGFKDPVRVVLQVDQQGLPKRVNKRFAIVLKYIYEE